MFVLLRALLGQAHGAESCAEQSKTQLNMKRAGKQMSRALADSPALFS